MQHELVRFKKGLPGRCDMDGPFGAFLIFILILAPIKILWEIGIYKKYTNFENEKQRKSRDS